MHFKDTCFRGHEAPRFLLYPQFPHDRILAECLILNYRLFRQSYVPNYLSSLASRNCWDMSIIL